LIYENIHEKRNTSAMMKFHPVLPNQEARSGIATNTMENPPALSSAGFSLRPLMGLSGK